MTIDFWGLGLQAVNVLILVWLLSKVFWRPLATAITKRQDTVKAMLNDAKVAQDKADAALVEITKKRKGIAEQREALLADAATKAETTAKTALIEAHDKAEKLIDAARLTSEREAEASSAKNAIKSAELAVVIAKKLLGRLDTATVQDAFLSLLIEAIEQIPANDRAALVKSVPVIDLVSARDLKETDKARITKAIHQALGGDPKLSFETDRDLIAGLEMRTPHFVLHNSWRSDLTMIQKNVNDAA
jgi:F-type H+-transporting ATPase subunit b